MPQGVEHYSALREGDSSSDAQTLDAAGVEHVLTTSAPALRFC